MTVEIKNDRVEEIVKNMKQLMRRELYVGIPATSIRTDGTYNAMLAYIHEFGAPAANIPARPFLQPAIKRMTERAIERMRLAGIAALDSKLADTDKQFEALGLEIATKAKDIISEGIPPPLKPSTIAARTRKHGGVAGDWTPLLDTGQMQAAITYKLVLI